jgi:hypothetical protein
MGSGSSETATAGACNSEESEPHEARRAGDSRVVRDETSSEGDRRVAGVHHGEHKASEDQPGRTDSSCLVLTIVVERPATPGENQRGVDRVLASRWWCTSPCVRRVLGEHHEAQRVRVKPFLHDREGEVERVHELTRRDRREHPGILTLGHGVGPKVQHGAVGARRGEGQGSSQNRHCGNPTLIESLHCSSPYPTNSRDVDSEVPSLNINGSGII